MRSEVLLVLALAMIKRLSVTTGVMVANGTPKRLVANTLTRFSHFLAVPLFTSTSVGGDLGRAIAESASSYLALAVENNANASGGRGGLAVGEGVGKAVGAGVGGAGVGKAVGVGVGEAVITSAGVANMRSSTTSRAEVTVLATTGPGVACHGPCSKYQPSHNTEPRVLPYKPAEIVHVPSNDVGLTTQKLRFPIPCIKPILSSCLGGYNRP
jgi:hypothetical protein